MPETDGATSPRPGIDAGGLTAPRSIPRQQGAMVSAVDAVVEHPLTPEDVAALLQVDRETIYRMARRGELPAFKVSTRWRFLPSQLQRWMEEENNTAAG